MYLDFPGSSGSDSSNIIISANRISLSRASRRASSYSSSALYLRTSAIRSEAPDTIPCPEDDDCEDAIDQNPYHRVDHHPHPAATAPMNLRPVTTDRSPPSSRSALAWAFASRSTACEQTAGLLEATQPATSIVGRSISTIRHIFRNPFHVVGALFGLPLPLGPLARQIHRRKNGQHRRADCKRPPDRSRQEP